MLEIEKIQERLKEIPTVIEQLIAEKNQLLGYQQAINDSDKKNADNKEKKEKLKRQ